MTDLKQPLISFCILTYKQPEEVRRLLKTLEPQLTSEVEILIRDDSPDNLTEDIIKKEFSSMPLRYIHGEKGGIDRTVIWLVENAKGKYVWWMGDDELKPNAISVVLNTLRDKPDVGFLWVNFRAEGSQNPHLMIDSDRFFEDKNEVLSCGIVGGLGFVSATIIKQDLAKEALTGALKYVGTEFSNLYIVMYVIAHSKALFALKDDYIIAHPIQHKENVFYRGFQVFGVYYYQIISSFKDDFKKGAIRKILKDNFNHIWRDILVARGKNFNINFSPFTKRFWTLTRLYYTFPEYYIVLPMLLLPKQINIALYKFYKKFIKK